MAILVFFVYVFSFRVLFYAGGGLLARDSRESILRDKGTKRGTNGGSETNNGVNKQMNKQKNGQTNEKKQGNDG